MNTHYRIRTPEVVHDTIDGEVIIINFDSGNYYSLQAVGTFIWSMLDGSTSVSQMVEQLTSHYDGTRTQIEDALHTFLNELHTNNLIAETTPQKTISPTKSTNGSNRQASKQPFAVPVLEAFTDMQALLLLDPIHEVSQEGWPHPQEKVLQ